MFPMKLKIIKISILDSPSTQIKPKKPTILSVPPTIIPIGEEVQFPPKKIITFFLLQEPKAVIFQIAQKEKIKKEA